MRLSDQPSGEPDPNAPAPGPEPATSPAKYLPAPPPYQGPTRCPACAGAGITGRRYAFRPNPAKPGLLLDVLCPRCDGCGHATHTDCDPQAHGEWNPHDDSTRDPDDEDRLDVCPSCHGRRWWAMRAFSRTIVYTLRTPCGCAEPLLVEVASA